MKADSSIKMLYLETPANPTLNCVDIEALTNIAKQYNLIVACDNTFATPYLQQPFKYGVDYVFTQHYKIFKRAMVLPLAAMLIGRDIEKNEYACYQSASFIRRQQ